MFYLALIPTIVLKLPLLKVRSFSPLRFFKTWHHLSPEFGKIGEVWNLFSSLEAVQRNNLWSSWKQWSGVHFNQTAIWSRSRSGGEAICACCCMLGNVIGSSCLITYCSCFLDARESFCGYFTHKLRHSPDWSTIISSSLRYKCMHCKYSYRVWLFVCGCACMMAYHHLSVGTKGK